MLKLKKYKKIEESDYDKYERLINLHLEIGYSIVENSYEVKNESGSQIFSQQLFLDNDISLGKVNHYSPSTRMKKYFPDIPDHFGIYIIEKNKPLIYKSSWTKHIEWFENYQIKRLEYDGRLKTWYENGNRSQFYYYLEGYDEPNSRIDRVIYYYENGLEKEIQEYYEPRTESWDMTHQSFSRVDNYTTGWTSYTFHEKGQNRKNEVINYKYEYDGGKTGVLSSGTSYIHGPYKQFFNNKIIYEGLYKNGVKHGEFKDYNVIHDYMDNKENWNHGELIESISYNEDGSVKE